MISLLVITVIAVIAALVMLGAAYGLLLARARQLSTRLSWADHAMAWVYALTILLMVLGVYATAFAIPGWILFASLLVYAICATERAIKKEKRSRAIP